MIISPEIAQKYWLLAAQEQVTLDYEQRGYIVQRNKLFEKIEADLVARKGKKIVIVEFKSGTWSSAKARKSKALRNYAVHSLGAEFRLVFVAPPSEAEFEIEGFEELLHGELIDSSNDDVLELSTHSLIEDVDGIEFENVHFSKFGLRVIGSATVYISLQYGSNSDLKSDIGFKTEDSYPLNFNIVINQKMEIIERECLRIDTSSFYE